MPISWPFGAPAIGALLVLASCGGRIGSDQESTPDAGAPDQLGPDASSDENPPDAPVSLPPPRVVLFGGFGLDNEPLNDTWIFDGATWSSVAAPSPPPARFEASMAALDAGGREEVVLFGGMVGNPGDTSDDTWLFDGTTWSQVMTATSPPARMNASMATLGGRVVLFGGQAGIGGAFGDTWTFDGTNWSAVTVPGPPARAFASMATLGNEVVLFGGADVTGTAIGDTWTFDGTTWSRASVTGGPPSRYNAPGATLGGAFYIFGGGAGSTTDVTGLGDTWSFDGTRWTAGNGSTPILPEAVAPFGGELVGVELVNLSCSTWTFAGTSWSELGAAPFSARTLTTMTAWP